VSKCVEMWTLSFYIERVEMCRSAVLYWSGFHPVAKIEGFGRELSRTVFTPTFEIKYQYRTQRSEIYA